MTTEEAKVQIEYRKDFATPAQIEALDMAIKTLEQEPCEDCVSRQAVLDVIEREQFKGDAVSEIEKLPPVTPERPKGEWVKYSIPRCGEQHYKCSHCDEYVNFGLYGDFYTKDFIYCPHCGADMRGVSG